jgi:hypothetical protein
MSESGMHETDRSAKRERAMQDGDHKQLALP